MTRHALAAAAALTIAVAAADVPAHSQDEETDPLVRKKLEWFRDQKFGLILHWGTYSQWGIVESWSICSEDEPWCRRTMDNYTDYCRAYEELKTTFNPVRFDPGTWADAARDAGMRYLVFTTKHHDGFCMFGTHLTDYCVTDTGCPFHANPRADITREVFTAFRKRGFGIGAYFSKPDWHSPWYWNPSWAHADRNANYSIAKHPDLWKKFQEYTFGQVEELMTGYGPIDILWLDGGWVHPGNLGQDVRIPEIAAMARSHQKGLIIVDRSVPGRFENYRTPEQQIPDTLLPYAWETCMTMGNSWSYVPGDRYKPAGTIIRTLVEIVAKGGNLLLGIGPDASGELPPESVTRLHEIGRWMTVNGCAIYGTRPAPPWKEGNLRFTRERSGALNAIYVAADGENSPPAKIVLRSFSARPGSAIHMLGKSNPVTWHSGERGLSIELTEDQMRDLPCEHAWTFRIDQPIERR